MTNDMTRRNDMTPEKARESVEKARTPVEEIAGRLDQLESYYSRNTQGREYVVNVKRHNDYVELDDIVTLVEEKWGRKLSDGAKEWLAGDIDIEQIWESWLGVEREYVVEGLFSGVRYASIPYWHNIVEALKSGLPTPYRELQECKTQEEKINRVLEWQQQEAKERNYLALLDRFQPSWYGREGGYFALTGAYGELEGYLSDIKDHFSSLDECLESMDQTSDSEHDWDSLALFYDEQMRALDTLVPDYAELAEAVLWFMKTVDEYNKGLDFRVEMIQRVEDSLDEARHRKIVLYADEVEKLVRRAQDQHARTHLISTAMERDRWGGDLYRYDDKDGDLMSLLFYPTGTPGYLGESEIFFIELPEEDGVKDFTHWLETKRQQCLAEDRQRREAEDREAAREAREGI